MYTESHWRSASLSLPSAALSSTFTLARRVFNSRPRALFSLSTVAVPLASSVVAAGLALPPSLDAGGFGLDAPDAAGDGDAPSREGELPSRSLFARASWSSESLNDFAEPWIFARLSFSLAAASPRLWLCTSAPPETRIAIRNVGVR